jgi:hypothetical protein
VGDGVYELTVNVPQAGHYMIFIESRSQQVTFRQLPYLMLQATQSTDAAKPEVTQP